eukprot:tig00021234_g19409.t1
MLRALATGGRAARSRAALQSRAASTAAGQKPAVVLLSGGLDSATCVAIAQDMGFRVHALSFEYGQRHKVELERSKQIARAQGVIEHKIAHIDLRTFGRSALTDDIDVPKGRDESELSSSIPITYVPARNTIFLSYALAFAEVRESSDIFIGANNVDYSGRAHPSPARAPSLPAAHAAGAAPRQAAVEGTVKLRIHTPLMELRKEDIIRRGLALGVDYGITSSCYDPGPEGRPCGACDSCQIRGQAFARLGMRDPAVERFEKAR